MTLLATVLFSNNEKRNCFAKLEGCRTIVDTIAIKMHTGFMAYRAIDSVCDSLYGKLSGMTAEQLFNEAIGLDGAEDFESFKAILDMMINNGLLSQGTGPNAKLYYYRNDS